MIMEFDDVEIRIPGLIPDKGDHFWRHYKMNNLDEFRSMMTGVSIVSPLYLEDEEFQKYMDEIVCETAEALKVRFDINEETTSETFYIQVVASWNKVVSNHGGLKGQFGSYISTICGYSDEMRFNSKVIWTGENPKLEKFELDGWFDKHGKKIVQEKFDFWADVVDAYGSVDAFMECLPD